MKNIAFILWILGWPFIISLSNYIDARRRKENDEEKWKDDDIGIMLLIIWIGVAVSVYEK